MVTSHDVAPCCRKFSRCAAVAPALLLTLGIVSGLSRPSGHEAADAVCDPSKSGEACAEEDSEESLLMQQRPAAPRAALPEGASASAWYAEFSDMRLMVEEHVSKKVELDADEVKTELQALYGFFASTRVESYRVVQKATGRRVARIVADTEADGQAVDNRSANGAGLTPWDASWENVLGNVKVTPLKKFSPSSLQELVDVHEQALTAQTSIKAVGSGCSYSTCTTTNGFLITTHHLNRVACAAGTGSKISGQLSASQLRPGNPPLINVGDPVPWSNYNPHEHQALFETEAGITIEDLAFKLEDSDLALTNIGGGKWQTLAGYISTSTHGTGIQHGPISDAVRSLVLVTTGKWTANNASEATVVEANGSSASNVYIYRIEPRNGITDPSKYAHENITLVQSDEAFRAVSTSFGSMGVLYSVVLDVMQFYWVKRVGSRRYWSDFLKELQPVEPTATNPFGEPSVLRESRNAQYYRSPYTIRPYKKDSEEHWAVEQRFDIVPRPEGPSASEPFEYFEVLGEWLLEDVPESLKSKQIVFDFLSVVLKVVPQLTPLFCNIFISLETREVVGKWYDVYDSGTPIRAGLASEWALPLQVNNERDGQFGSFAVWPRKSSAAGNFSTDVMQQAIEVADVMVAAEEKYAHYMTSPYKLRFVKGSESYLSMMNSVTTGMIELRMLKDTFAYESTLTRIGYEMLRTCGARFHWGLDFSQWSGADGLLQMMYPDVSKWLQQMDMFNAQGSYTNQYTILLGLSGKGQGLAAT